MDFEKAYELLDEISQKEKLDLEDEKSVINLSKNNNAEIRAYSAELLVSFKSVKAKKALIDLCADSDEMVRVNACDSLSEFSEEDVYNRLAECAVNDKSELVRKYALLSLSDIVVDIKQNKNTAKKLFSEIMQNEESLILKACCCKGLYVLGDKDYLSDISELIKSENYQDRCTAVNILGDIFSYDIQAVSDILMNLRKTETSKAVISAIDSIINKKRI